jgi:hypothetical protein
VLAWSLRRDAPSADPTQRQASSRAPRSGGRQLPAHHVGAGVESSPALSPDAALVAYVAVPAGQRRTAIMLQTTDPSTPRQLSHPRATPRTARLSWSPNGREIAFLRVSDGHDCRVMVVPSNGGTERSVGSCDPRNPPSFDWTFDGRGHGLRQPRHAHRRRRAAPAGLASGEWRLLDYGATAPGRGLRAALLARRPLDRVRAQFAGRGPVPDSQHGGPAQR